MRKTFDHTSNIKYNLQGGYQYNTLYLKLTIDTQNILKVFAFNYNHENLPFQCQKLSLDGQKIYQILQDKRKYQINSIRGDIIIRWLQKNAKAYTPIILPLTKVYEQQKNTPYGKTQSMQQPKHSLFQQVQVLTDQFQYKAKSFQRGMQIWRKKFNQRIDKIKDDYQIDWKWQHTDGQNIYGSYFGQQRNQIPHGVGIFYFQDANVDRIQGDWKNGKLDGKAVSYAINGNYDESEWKDGKLFGFYVCHFKDGTRQQYEHVVDGKAFGKNRKYNKSGAMIKEQVFQNGKVIQKRK